MSALRKLIPGRKKSKKSSSASLRSATSEQNLAEGPAEPGYKNVKEKDLPKLHKAAWNGDLAKVRQLAKKADINQMDKHHRTALHYACVRGFHDITEFLCVSRVKLGICDADGRTALTKAVECAKEACVETLLNHGAETNVVDVGLATPLHLNATHGGIRIATMLLERDARVNAVDVEKLTPLHVAASFGFPEFVEFLLKEYALVNEVDAYGKTALISASSEGHTAVVKLLLEYGADTEIKDSEGWKAADHAVMNGHHHIANLIEESLDRDEPEVASNLGSGVGSRLGSGVGSPFKSNSTQPVSSMFGGPAINLNNDSEDDSTRQDSPIKPDFENSWADSDTDVEEEPKNAPSLTTALERKTSAISSKSVSRIPLASASKENLSPNRKDGSSTSLDNTKPGTSTSTSKIPRFDSGNSKQNLKSPSKEAGIPPLPTQPQHSKIPVSKGKISQPTSPEDDAVKKASQSKIPRLSASPSPTRKAMGAEKAGVKSPKESEMSPAKQSSSPKKASMSVEYGNSELSDWDSDSEDFSQADVYAALGGNQSKKKSEEQTKDKKINLKERFSMFQASSAKSSAKNSDDSEGEADGRSPSKSKTQHPVKATNPKLKNEDKPDKNEAAVQKEVDKNQTKSEEKHSGEKVKKLDSDWDSSSEDISTPKPAVLKKKESVEEKLEGKDRGKSPAKQKADFDLDLGWDDTSEATSQISSPELVEKPQIKMAAEAKASKLKTAINESPNKDNDDSEFSDFSLQESEHVASIPTKKTEESQIDDKLSKKQKEKEERRAQLSALGLDLGSSISSVSEDFGELDTSLTKHDQLFQAMPATKSNEDSKTKIDQGARLQDEDKLKDTIDSGLGKTNGTEKGITNTDTEGTKKSASKAQYDALGINFSDGDESISITESESEWELSLQKKRELKKATGEGGKNMEAGKVAEESKQESDSEIVVDGNAKLANAARDIKIKLNEESINPDSMHEKSPMRDSEFISDENFSIETEDQLEELESERLKALGDNEDERSNIEGDFDDGSDFSFTESKNSVEENEAADNEAAESNNEATDNRDESEIEFSVSINEASDDDIQAEDDSPADNNGVTPDKSSDVQLKSKSQMDMERMKILQSIAKTTAETKNTEQSVSHERNERKLPVPPGGKSNDDAERRMKLEAMVRPPQIQPVEQPAVESVPELRNENMSIEDEFERKLIEKEEESRKETARLEEEMKEAQRRVLEDQMRREEEDEARRREDQEKKKRQAEHELAKRQEEEERRRAQEELEAKQREEEWQERIEERYESEKGRLSEEEQQEDDERKMEEFEQQMRLKEEQKQRELEEEIQRTFEAEKQRIRKENEEQMKKHQEDLRRRERQFEEEIQKRESEEKRKREEKLAVREREREELKQKQIQGIEDEYARLQEEKVMWQKKQEEQTEKIRRDQLELEALAKKRIQEEMKADEASIRLKEQEQLWQQQQANGGTDSSTELRNRELEELMQIEGMLKDSAKREDERKIQEHIVNEDLIPFNRASQQQAPSVENVIIQPVKTSNVYSSNDSIRLPVKNQPANENAQKHLSQSRQKRNEAELLLQAARDKTNAIMTGQRFSSPPLRFNSSQMAPNVDDSEFGDNTVDGKFANNQSEMENANEPRHQPPDQEVGYPTTSSPYQPLRHSLDPRIVGNEDLSPVMRPKSTLGTTEDEGERIAASYKAATPTALYNSLSQSGHFQDSKALMKMQDSLRETKRELEKSKARNAALENAKRDMEVDMRELQRAVELLSKSQTDFERFRLEAEMELRDMKYRLEQEFESKAAVDGLNMQLKEQLKRAEDKLVSEGEARQTIELAYKTMEAEFKVRENLVNQLENDITDLRFSLSHERESRVNQEKMYTEQLQQHEALLEEAQHTSFQHAQTVGQLEALDLNRKSAEAAIDNLKVEFAKAKGELTRVTSQLEETKSTYENEVSRLRTKLQEKSDALVSSEREQFQAQMKMEADRSTAKADQLRLSSNLENEVANKKRIQTELNVLKTQLQNANSELERISKTKSIAENEVSRFKEETHKDRNKQDREITAVREELQRSSVKLESTERRCDSIESELQNANIALAEKSGQLVMANREMEYKNNILNQLEEKVRNEKELNQRLVNKIETQNERAAILQREIDNLRRELEMANQRAVAFDKSARDSQEKFKNLMAGAKDDYDKDRFNFEARIGQLNEAVDRYRSDLSEAKEEIKQKDTDIRSIEKEVNDLSRKLAAVEASNEIQMKTRQQLEEDRSRLSRESALLERNVSDLESQRNELLNKVDDLTEQLEHTLKVSDHTSSKLAQRAADVQTAKQTRAELEKSLMRLKVDKAELESALREEKSQAEMLLDDLRQSNDARESLEKLLSNVKSSNMHLEEKLQSETLSRVQRERDADEHKDLWNSEVKSRSKLGLKLVQMEKEVSYLKSELEEEKRNTIIAVEGKKNIEAKLELYDKRAVQHQKEINAIRGKLRQYQRRLKDYENGESKLPKAYAEFERERDLMLNNTSNLRRQIDNVNDQLRQEQENRSRAEINAKQNINELTELKTREKILAYERDKLEKENQALEDEMEQIKDYYERNFVAKNNMEAFKKDIETKARLEINRKLQEVNMQLEEQAIARETYDRVRNENESKSKKELENTINGLRGELSMVKVALQDGLVKKSTYETEASRLKELYQSEVADKHKLTEKVNQLADRFADSTARLSYEKSRNQQLMDFTSSPRTSPLKNSTVLPGEREDYLRSTLRDVDVKPLVRRAGDSYISPIPRRNFLS